MPYTSSKASTAMGTVFSVGPLAGTPTPTYTAVAEFINAEFSGARRDVVFTTNMSSGGIKEKLDTLADFGNCKITMNRISNDPGQQALWTNFAAGGKYLFKVQLPVDTEVGQATTGDLLEFAAVISDGPSYSLDIDKVPVVSYTLDISGAITLTEGA